MRWLDKVLTVNFTVSVLSPSVWSRAVRVEGAARKVRGCAAYVFYRRRVQEQSLNRLFPGTLPPHPRPTWLASALSYFLLVT
eukprot:5872056-Pyramimonas_sp.AAC.1